MHLVFQQPCIWTSSNIMHEHWMLTRLFWMFSVKDGYKKKEERK